jgi:hypothetical protein
MKCEHIHEKLSEYLEGLLDHEHPRLALKAAALLSHS